MFAVQRMSESRVTILSELLKKVNSLLGLQDCHPNYCRLGGLMEVLYQRGQVVFF